MKKKIWKQSKRNMNRIKEMFSNFWKTFVSFLQLELLHWEFGFFCPCGGYLVNPGCVASRTQPLFCERCFVAFSARPRALVCGVPPL
jgi:hypothetical protein